MLIFVLQSLKNIKRILSFQVGQILYCLHSYPFEYMAIFLLFIQLVMFAFWFIMNNAAMKILVMSSGSNMPLFSEDLMDVKFRVNWLPGW